ncbi:Autophagy-related protein 2 [Talaromyces atroroseus]|uniref:Autophagy-related protein 2 n=1 Tax=Talaromyces atroroseus TaxID=1441469 RepID=A0A225AHD4_TALAT|nr:Autophagy-related protein 2 [Talaromyces atroroseus]OKL60831.1 Autophagy-related protein 2 [Talaromyces atroroseus]
MDYFLPSFVQKRLLRYALSRLELVDTDAIDLDSLGIRWGQRSTFELRDIGLRLEKLASILQLPSTCKLLKARSSLIRVTIPADIYNSGIIFEVDGVDVHIQLLSGDDSKSGKPILSSASEQPVLPTTDDLAQSFIQSEPREERAEIEAAISSQSQYLQRSTASLSEDDEVGLGNEEVSLPTFISGFLQGILSRLQIKINNINIRVDMDLPQDGPTKKVPVDKPDQITASMIIEEVSISSVAETEDQSASSRVAGRTVTLDSIRVLLISDPVVFSNYARFAEAPPSPSTTTSKVGHVPDTVHGITRSQPISPSTGSQPELAESALLYRSQMTVPYSNPTMPGEEFMESSTDSLDGRFSDAESEPGDEYQRQDYSVSGSHYDGIIDSPAYLDDVFHSQFVDDPERSIEIYPKSPQSTGTPRPRSPQLDSSHAPETWHDFDEPRSLAHTDDSAEHAYFHESLSRSQKSIGTSRSPSPEPTPASYSADLSNSTISADGDSTIQSSNSSSHSGSLPDDLSESKLFSHEEASSMYMSAISGTSDHDAPVMPGGWDSTRFGSDIDSHGRERKIGVYTAKDFSDDADVSTPRIGSQSVSSLSQTNDEDAPQILPGESHNAALDPQPCPSAAESSVDPDVAREIIDISRITIWIPEGYGSSGMEQQSISQHDRPKSSGSQSMRGDLLEASNVDYSMSMRRSSISSSIAFDNAEQSGHKGPDVFEPITFTNAPGAISVDVNEVLFLFDIATGWLLVKASQKLATAFNVEPPESKPSSNNHQASSSKYQHFRLNLHSCAIKFLEHLADVPYRAQETATATKLPRSSFSAVDDIILQAQLSSVNSDLFISEETMKFQLEVAKFVLGCASETLISFNKELRMRDSVRDIQVTSPRDISLTVTKTPASARINITTLPVHLNLNIQRLEEILGWLGGLSTLMELGSSMASISTVRGDKPDTPKKPTRGVRFEGMPTPEAPTSIATSAPWKINARLGGIMLDIVGETCALKLNTTAVKAVSRYEGIGIQIDKAKVIGPCFPDDNGEYPATLSLGNIRTEYLYSPKEVDLDRLLSLLTPSKDKYEEDDDIMLDTLFRQRRQGGVLRVAVTTAKLLISDLEGLGPLSYLPLEIARLSSVTKYLPEDDRPGIMTLLLIRDFECNTHVDEKIGDLRAVTQDIEMAHISLPSLIAAQVKSLSLLRNETEELVGEALKTSANVSAAQPSLPMIMARFIADEMDPTVKIKFHSFRVEYTLPSIIAFLGLESNTTPEDLAATMAASVANLTDLRNSRNQSMSSGAYGVLEPDAKPFKLAVSLRDCVVGLNPRDMPAKGLMVLTYSKFKYTDPGNGSSEANFEIKKATVMIIDDVSMVGSGDTSSSQRTIVDSQNEQLRGFANVGFVPVSYISSAVFSVNMLPPDADGNKSVDVEVRDDLLILETCADSTQTLIGLLSGLAPPSLPSSTLKYRTEVMPLQDMLSSFTGEAFTTDQVTNADEISVHESEDNFEGALDDELDYVSDFYPKGPDSEEPMSTSTMMDPMADMSRSRRLMDSFHSEYNVSTSITGLEFRDDHFARKSTVGGTAHRWDSTHNTYGLANEVKLHGSPLRVRVRDVHFIWNLFDGYDWQRTRDTISRAVKDVEMKAAERRAKATSRLSPEDDEEESVIGDFLFNSIYIGIPANKDPRELSRAINHDIDDMISETGSYITSTTVTGLSANRQNRPPSVRGKRLRLSRSKHHKMTFELKGVSADFVVFPPDSSETQSTMDVRVNDLEIFDHIPTSTWKKFATYMNDAGERESGTSMVHLEILNVKPVAELAASEIVLKATILPLRLHVDQDALDFLSRFFEFKDESAPAPSTPGDAPFLQRVEINSVRVKLDFKPKRVDYAGLRSGRTTEFMNFFILDEADMVMRHVIIYGVSGFDRLGQTLNDIWMPDIKRNQLPVRSIQKGAFSFAKTTTNELIKLGAKLAIGTQTVLQSAEDFLNAPSTGTGHLEGDGDSGDEDEKKQISHYADQPVGVVQGLRGAFRSLERDLLMTRDAIVAVPGEVMESSSAAGAAKAVWRRAPTVILRPAIGATRAVGQTLLGAGNTLDPTNRRRIEDYISAANHL